MAILSHRWLMLWRKKHIFINISWHGGCGPLLSPFEHLEVPVPHKSFVTSPNFSEYPVPLTYVILYCNKVTGYSEKFGKVMKDL